MNMGWVQQTIGELCEQGGGKVQTGPFGSQLHQTDYSEEGTPVVMPTDILTGQIDLSRIARVSDAHVHRLSRHKLRRGDIVYGRRGDIGRQALVREANVGWLCGTGCLTIRLGKAEVDPEYLHRYLTLPELIGWIEGQAIGATMPNLNTDILNRVPIRYPTWGEQRKIAAILTAYDDLIETNKRSIALLEKMAQEIYREWFVRMRFPGHRNTKFVKGVPEGWEVRDLRDRAELNPSSLGRNDRPNFIHYVDIGSVTTNRIEDIESIPLSKAPGRAKRCVQHGDIIWSSVRPANRAYCLIYEPAENTIVSTGFAVIRPKPETPFTFLNFAVTSDGFVDQMAAVAKGAAYPATSFDDFEKARVLWPGVDLLQHFHNVCEPLFRQQHTLTEQARVLTKTRDLLLPRVISGKLSVADLDIQFPPSMCEGAKGQGPIS